jgi:hypothetical protein
MFGCKFISPNYVQPDSSSNHFNKSAIIEARNVYMFKVEEAVLVYRVVRGKSTRKWIM